MKLTLTPEMLAALEKTVDRPDWLTDRLTVIRAGGEPFILQLKNEESTALEELCAMNIRFNENGDVLPEHQPLDELSIMVMEAY
jgi:organic radical activating enzyme